MKKLSLGLFIASFLFLSLNASAAGYRTKYYANQRFDFGIKELLCASTITNAQKFYSGVFHLTNKAGLFNSTKIGGGGGIYG